MAAITNPANIPTGKRAAVSAVCVAIGPKIVPGMFPKEVDGSFKTTLTTAETGNVFEAVTREFWRQQIEALEAKAAAEAARLASVAANAADPFV